MNLKKIIKEEIDDFDWVREIDPYKQIKDYYKDYKNPSKLDVEKLINDYNRINHKKEGIQLVVKRITGRDVLDPEELSAFRTALKKFIKQNTNPIKRFFSSMGYGGMQYDMENFQDMMIGRFVKESEEDDFDWIRDTKPGDIHSPFVGMKWKVVKYGPNRRDLPEIYEITDMLDTSMTIAWFDSTGKTRITNYDLMSYFNLVKDGNVEIVI